MRTYKLTAKGKVVARTPTQARNPLIDKIWQNPGHEATYDELVAEIGRERIMPLLKQAKKLHYVEETEEGGGAWG